MSWLQHPWLKVIARAHVGQFGQECVLRKVRSVKPTTGGTRRVCSGLRSGFSPLFRHLLTREPAPCCTPGWQVRTCQSSLASWASKTKLKTKVPVQREEVAWVPLEGLTLRLPKRLLSEAEWRWWEERSTRLNKREKGLLKGQSWGVRGTWWAVVSEGRAESKAIKLTDWTTFRFLSGQLETKT